MSHDAELLSGRYRLGELIGVGGMSDVFRAEDELLGRSVAVKKMRADLARDENFLARFRREAKNAAVLNHPNIVSVYDTGETAGPMGTIPFIVMELVQGETLRDLVRREGPMEIHRAAAIMAEVVDALEFSHQAGIVHRDIKPANIMLTNTGAVKVMDFGIARALGDSTTMTQTAAVIGTAQYLSPEQARGQNAEARSDIYSAGCVLFEAITGQPPFTGETPLSVAYQHVQDAPPSVAKYLPALDAKEVRAIDAVLLTAMAKDPLERYDSAADFAEELRRIARKEVPLAARPHMGRAGTKGAGAAGAAGAAAAGAAGAAGLAGAAGAAGAAAGNADDAPTTAFASSDYDYDDSDFAGHAYDQQAYGGQRREAQTYAPGTGQQQQVQPSGGAGEDTKKKSAGVIAIWSVLAVLLAGGVAFASYHLFTGETEQQSVAIPEVAGMNATQAQKALEDAGFAVTQEFQPDPEVPRNFAIGTDPTVGSNLARGSSVTLIVSSGPEITDVPDVRDQPAEDARRILQEAGLTVDPTLREEPHEEIPRGHVIEQSPAAGSQVNKGTRVTLTVSSGLEMATVPDVAGQSLESARTTLESMGFVVQVNEVDSAEPAGRVLRTPQAGQTLTVGTTVEVEVSRGNQFRMPNLRDKTVEEADQILRDAGFTGTIRQETRDTLNPAQVGRVESTQPRRDAMVNKDSEITIVVYQLGINPGDNGEDEGRGILDGLIN